MAELVCQCIIGANAALDNRIMGYYFSFFLYFSEFIFKEKTYCFAFRDKDFKLKYLHILCFGFIVVNIAEIPSVPVTLA